MSITQGNILANYRYNPITQAEVTETVTAETATVAELTELPGVYGFELREAPQSSPPGISSVTRVSGGVSFSYVATAPGANQYYIDYTNNSPLVIVPSSEDGLQFTVAYNAVGAPDSVKNTQLIAATAGGLDGIIKANRTTSYSTAVDATKTLSAKISSIFNLSVATTKTLTIDQALQGFGILQVFGDITLTGTAILSLKRTVLIVYGNITGTGTIQAPKNTGDGGAGSVSFAGSTAGANAYTELGGAGGTTDGTDAGGGGGGFGNGGNAPSLSNNGNPGSQGGGGSGGSWGASNVGGAGGAAVNYIVSAGGTGGTGVNSGGYGGAGGGGGGQHLIIFCFGTIGSGLTLRSGLPGVGGTGGSGLTTHGTGGTAGDLYLFSQYTSAPCTVNVNKGTTFGDKRDGANGTAYYNSLDIGNFQGLINDFAFYTKTGTTF